MEDEKIPNDIMFQILIRLPILALLRFRCVSRVWYALISSVDFVDAYRRRNGKQICANYNLLFTKMIQFPENKDVFSLLNDEEPFHEVKSFEFPINNVIMVGVANGLICLNMVLKKLNTYLLWNPFIKKVLVLPEFITKMPDPVIVKNKPTVPWFQIFDTCFGFGYDTLSDDFKVVRMLGYGRKVDDDQPITSLSTFGIFSVSTRSWKTLDYNAPMYTCSQPCNVGHFLYRLSFLIDNRVTVLSIDLNSEVFEEIDLPRDEDPYKRGGKDDLVVYRDTLGLLRVWDYVDCELWALKVDGVTKSWTKHFTVILDDSDILGHQIVGFTVKGALLVIGDCNLTVVPAEEDAQIVKYEPSGTQPTDQHEWQLDLFGESLALMNDGIDQSLIET